MRAGPGAAARVCAAQGAEVSPGLGDEGNGWCGGSVSGNTVTVLLVTPAFSCTAFIWSKRRTSGLTYSVHSGVHSFVHFYEENGAEEARECLRGRDV